MARKFLTAIDMSKLELQNAVIQNLGSAPSSPVAGQMYYDTGGNVLYWYNGTTWVSASGGALSYATTADLANVDHAAEAAGSATTVARGDHKHDVNTGTPVAIGTANGAGSASTLALSDHIHLQQVHDHSGSTTGGATISTTTISSVNFFFPNQVAPAPTSEGQAYWDTDDDVIVVGNGSSGTVIAKVAATTPTTQAFGDAAAGGSAKEASRIDHKHAMPTHALATHQEMLATTDLTDWPRTAALDLASQKITSVLDPTAAQDAATKAYVDATAAGLDWKGSVRLATTGAIANLATGAPNTVDGVSTAVNDRILVKDMATGSLNGIYTVTTVGTGSNGVWTRATDADSSAEVNSGMAVFVEEGTTYADTGWVLTTNNPITLGTTSLVFAQFTALGQVTAGNGLTKTGSTLDVGAGTGVSVAADSVGIDTAVVVRKYAIDIGGSTAITVTHNLGTKDVEAQVFDNTTPFAQVECDVEHTTTNTLTIRFATAPAAAAYRCVVQG